MNTKRRGRTSAKTSKGTRKARAGAPARSYKANWTVAANAGRSVKNRVAALAGLTRAVCDDNETFQGMLSILRDKSTPIAVRLAALSSLQAATFSVIKFNACRPAYLAALRSVASDPDPELRQRVLGVLSREHDGYAQKLLLEGLQKPEKALVPPEKALQLLSYDIHAEAYPVAREIVRKPPNAAAKREALRLLAADAASAPVFEKILRDKSESAEIRQLSASALLSLAPAKLQAHARAMVLDKSESDELKSTSLTALTHFGEEKAVAQDNALQKTVGLLIGKAAASAILKRVAKSFLAKYRR